MRKLTIAIASVIILVLFATGVVAIAAQGALKAIERQSDDIIGLAIDVERYSINWLTASFSLEEIKIYPAGKKGNKGELLASAEELRVRVTPRALLRKTLHADSITLVRPTINLYEYRNNKYNWNTINLGEGDDKSEWHVSIEDVKIEDGVLNYVSRPGGHRLRLTDVFIGIKDIESDADPEKLPTKLSIKSKIDEKKGTLKVKGRLNAFAEGVNFDLRSWIEDAPITYFSSFYAGRTPFPIRSGILNLSTKASAKKSKLVAYNTATIHNLQVGGGVRGKLVNAFLKGQRGPVVVKATVKGDLEKGGFSTASEISRGLGDGIFAQAKDANPLKGTGEKMIEGTKSVGRGIKGLFGK